jgi:glycosyltransferase involved in cell wall biosynthesis
MPKDSQLVSVVVPTKNTIRTIERCLRSIREQTWTAVELVVIDNFSTDGTWRVAQEFADVAIQAGPERSAQRNLGVEKASSEWVLWIDADMELPATILERAMEAAQRDRADGVFVPEVTVGDGYWTRCRALERSCCTEERLVQSPRLVRREYLLGTGGFQSSLTGTEDAELRTRMLEEGQTLTWIPDLIIHDEGRLELSGILRKRYYYGRGLAWYKRHHPGALSGQAVAAVGAYRRHWRRLTAEPTVAVGVAVMRVSELAAYGLGALVGATEHTARTRR